MKKIVVIGEILVEIMADTPGHGFRQAQALTGPYPSGAPAIFIDQVARLGQPCAILSNVGADDFGRMVLDRLAGDGVDVSGVGTSPDRPTGTAFVRYRPDGGRDFVFNIRHSACGQMPPAAAMAHLLAQAGHLHVMGSSLSSPEVTALNLQAAAAIKARGGSLSFDPNLRGDSLAAPGMAEALDRMLDLADLVLPSGDEILALTGARDAASAAAAILARGARGVVHKLGDQGARFHGPEGMRHCPAFAVQECDPTGAGDCFGGVFVTLWLRGAPLDVALDLASAAGALAVTQRGPMEGVADLARLQQFAQETPRGSHDSPPA